MVMLAAELGASLKPQVITRSSELVNLRKPLALFIAGEHSRTLSDVFSTLGVPQLVARLALRLTQLKRPISMFRHIGSATLLSVEFVEFSGSHPVTHCVCVVTGPEYAVVIMRRRGAAFTRIVERVLSECSSAEQVPRVVMDAAVNSYLAVLEAIEEDVELLEEEVVAKPSDTIMRRVLLLKRRVRRVRRASWGLREVLRELISISSEDERRHLRDVQDAILEAVNLAEVNRERLTDIISMYLTSISIKLNDIMRFLTVIGTIFIPLTFITGIYGMNFNTKVSPWNMPELNYPYGYPLVLLAMLAIALGMLLYFKRKGWV
ncbi:MAG: hypothetical protein DRO39_03225 [Thermoprotei archaeon]|mgnify:CR=1 FL=1|nr:MAG: hypothetical protein DRO39_03225 [Thermoprotei archaeon]